MALVMLIELLVYLSAKVPPLESLILFSRLSKNRHSVGDSVEKIRKWGTDAWPFLCVRPMVCKNTMALYGTSNKQWTRFAATALKCESWRDNPVLPLGPNTITSTSCVLLNE